MELPQEILDIQTDIMLKVAESQKISNEIVKCETKLKVMITGLVDDAGKKLYSNEDARRAAFSEMAEDDIELSELKEKNAQIERAIQEFRISFDCLNNEQKNIRAVLMFLSGKGE
jgi:Na+-transporting NADH:ubiquinone oxidoreductase subunit NqrC